MASKGCSARRSQPSVDAAVARGAAAVLVEYECTHGRGRRRSSSVDARRGGAGRIAGTILMTTPSRSLVGVTGTNGKTTVAYARGVARRPRRDGACGGTLGLGIGRQLAPPALTTADCLARPPRLRGPRRHARRDGGAVPRARRTAWTASHDTSRSSRTSAATTWTTTATWRTT